MTPNQCQCSMSISVLGDGCRYCQPQEHIDRLIEQMQDDEEAKSAPAEVAQGEAVEVVAWADESIGAFIDHDCKQYGEAMGGAAGSAVSSHKTALMTVAQHDRIVADVRANRDAVLNVMRAKRLLPKADPSPDAELVELLRESADYLRGISLPAQLVKRIDAKLASLRT